MICITPDSVEAGISNLFFKMAASNSCAFFPQWVKVVTIFLWPRFFLDSNFNFGFRFPEVTGVSGFYFPRGDRSDRGDDFSLGEIFHSDFFFTFVSRTLLLKKVKFNTLLLTYAQTNNCYPLKDNTKHREKQTGRRLYFYVLLRSVKAVMYITTAQC